MILRQNKGYKSLNIDFDKMLSKTRKYFQSQEAMKCYQFDETKEEENLLLKKGKMK
jgi:hypothetical protein